MARLTVSLAAGYYDRTAPLHDGIVAIDGCDVISHALVPEETFFRSFRHAEFDIAELSFSSYLAATSRGSCPYIAVPAFPSRSFRHTAIYVRAGSPISDPAQLKGKRVGVPEYQLTAHVWVRALLEEDHGVRTADIEWVTGGVEEIGRHEKIALDLPPAIRVVAAPPERTLSDMLIAGEIDALVCPRAPRAFAPDGAIRRLFADPAAAAADYYARRGIFPIMHVVGVRKALLDANPWLPASVFKAFDRSRHLAMERLADTTALSVSLPWLIEELDRTRHIMGHDFWSYGVEANRPAIEAFIDHHARQGLSRGMAVETVFHPATLEQFRI